MATQSKMVQRHGCVIVRNNSVLAKSSNKFRIHGYLGWMDDDSCSFHAEIAAMRQVKDLTNVTIYIARVNKRGEPRYSAPCASCQQAIDNAGIRKVVYTVD